MKKNAKIKWIDFIRNMFISVSSTFKSGQDVRWKICLYLVGHQRLYNWSYNINIVKEMRWRKTNHLSLTEIAAEFFVSHELIRARLYTIAFSMKSDASRLITKGPKFSTKNQSFSARCWKHAKIKQFLSSTFIKCIINCDEIWVYMQINQQSSKWFDIFIPYKNHKTHTWDELTKLITI